MDSNLYLLVSSANDCVDTSKTSVSKVAKGVVGEKEGKEDGQELRFEIYLYDTWQRESNDGVNTR
jgi:hypothetical protein